MKQLQIGTWVGHLTFMVPIHFFYYVNTTRQSYLNLPVVVCLNPWQIREIFMLFIFIGS